MSRIYAFDFDGVITEYSGFKGHGITDEPRLAVVEAIRTLHASGAKIIIHTTRGEKVMKDYMKKHDIPYTYINENPELEGENKGKPIATCYVDDRAVNYHGQSTEELVKALESFEPFWKE